MLLRDRRRGSVGGSVSVDRVLAGMMLLSVGRRLTKLGLWLVAGGSGLCAPTLLCRVVRAERLFSGASPESSAHIHLIWSVLLPFESKRKALGGPHRRASISTTLDDSPPPPAA